ncbi:MAG TPA: hypothetical protein VKM55_22970 [Candidatus Lokiarchaeia archaeon]|nr:hypothetical protein [Candidatus Lokiarchaeia archaeon]
MRWILDANTLIYLIKANLQDKFLQLIHDPAIIDSSVHEEVVERGIAQGHLDAIAAKRFLEENQIPIIPVDVSNDITYFKDVGEASCYNLTKQSGTCITSDTRAIKKLKTTGASCMQLDIFFLTKFLEHSIDEITLENTLDDLLHVNATTPERKMEILKKTRTIKTEDAP